MKTISIKVAILVLTIGLSSSARAASFLEASSYFITGVDADPDQGDEISEAGIRFKHWPAVVYMPVKKQCAVQVRTTTKPYTIWQVNFCAITHWQASSQHGYYSVTWYGGREGFCIKRDWTKDEDYPTLLDSTNAMCSPGDDGGYYRDGKDKWYQVWDSSYDIKTLVGGINFYVSDRSVSRMVASFKYIESLMTGKPY